VDDERCLVYGPSLGGLYLLTARDSLQRPLQTALGLGALGLENDLSDPVERIVHDLPSLRDLAVETAPAVLRMVYRFFHFSRPFLPFRFLVTLVSAASKLRSPDPSLTVSSIGRLLHAIESATGIANCYPRALMTCYLCLRSGRDCELAIGTLAPTRKMHAWCSTGGELPYEALPEHYMYRPLLILTVPRPA
jgi:hypothetical protein